MGNTNKSKSIALGVCNHCGKAQRYLECDHRIPKRFGGTDDDRNLHLLCISCHREKSHLECLIAAGGVNQYHSLWLAIAYPIREMKLESPDLYRKMNDYVREWEEGL